MDLKKEAIRGVKWTSLSTGFSFILGLIQIGIIARYLSIAEIGILSLVAIILDFTRALSDAGISNSIIHFQDLSQKQLNSLYWLNVILAILAALILYTLAPLISSLFPDTALVSFIRLVCIAIPLAAVGQQYLVQLKRDLAFQLISLVEMVIRLVIFLLIVILLVRYHCDLRAIIYATVIGAGLSGIIYFLVGSRRYFVPSLSKVSLAECRHCLEFGLFQMGSRTVGYLSSNLDKIIIGRFLGTTILGFYELATTLISRPINIINPIFNTVSFPLFSIMQEDLPRLNDWYIKKIALISLATAPIYCGMYAIRYDLVTFIYGAEKDTTAVIVGIICILGYFRSISNPLGTYVLALGKPHCSLYLNLYQLVIHSILLWIGVSYFEWERLLWIYVVGAIVMTVPAEYYLRFALSRMSVRHHLFIILRHLFIGIAMIIILIFIMPLFQGIGLSIMSRLMLAVTIGAVIYIVLNVVFNISLVREIKTLIRE